MYRLGDVETVRCPNVQESPEAGHAIPSTRASPLINGHARCAVARVKSRIPEGRWKANSVVGTSRGVQVCRGHHNIGIRMNTIQRIVRRLAMEMRHLLEGPSLQPALAGVPYAIRPEDPQGAPLKDFLEDMRDGILLAVPKHRRSLQRRMSRRIGMPQFEAKPRRDLKCCVECGHTYEAHTLCGHCYSKVRVESQAIQKAMEDSFGWNPIEQEVVVKYAGEDIKPEDKSKRIIERPTERPKFFSDNLLEKGHHKE